MGWEGVEWEGMSELGGDGMRQDQIEWNGIVIVVQSLSHVQLLVTPWAAVHQASLSFTVS